MRTSRKSRASLSSELEGVIRSLEKVKAEIAKIGAGIEPSRDLMLADVMLEDIRDLSEYLIFLTRKITRP